MTPKNQPNAVLDKFAKLDEVTIKLKELKNKLTLKEQISNEEIRSILESDYDEVLSDLK